VLTNVGSFQNEEQLATRAIIIEDDNLAQELLEQFITDIVVDGANNKWIGRRLRVLWFHQTGKKQSIILLKSNSPLPSNVINDDMIVRQEKSTSLLQRVSVF
jgi:hypothetical protein